jgi:hypothetical protein
MRRKWWKLEKRIKKLKRENAEDSAMQMSTEMR